MKRILWLAIVCAFGLYACKDDPKEAPAADVEGNGHVPGHVNTRSDAATDVEPEDDSGSVDESDILALRECENVDPAEALNEDVPFESRPSSVTVPSDFSVTRAVTTWTGKCDDPSLLIKLSDGRCVKGDGHELTFELSVNAIQVAHTIVVGENNIVSDADSLGIRVRYTRPATLVPDGTWGTCAGALGTIVIPELPELERDDTLLGMFQLTLTDCDPVDGGLGKAAVKVAGAFHANLARSLEDYCPSAK